MALMPPSLTGKPPLGSAPISTPTGSPGAQASAMAQLREAINILNQTISSLPPGYEIHSAVMAAITNLNKKSPPTAEVPGVQQTALRDLQQNAQKNAMLQQVMSSLGAGGAQSGGAGPVAGSPVPPQAGV